MPTEITGNKKYKYESFIYIYSVSLDLAGSDTPKIKQIFKLFTQSHLRYHVDDIQTDFINTAVFRLLTNKHGLP